jgi:signal transduction histidine kinase
VPSVSLVRFEPGRTSVVLASFNEPSFPVGSRWAHDGHSLNSIILETGAPARIDDYSEVPGAIAAAARSSGMQSGIGAPIVVDGKVWGMIAVGRRQHREVLPDYAGTYTSRMMFSTESSEGIESRLAAFTELVATAISRAQAQDQLHQLATEQAALRRVATLVAEGADSQAVFDAVCHETCSLVGASAVNLSYFTSDGFNLTRAGWSLRDTHVRVGTRLPLAPDDTVDAMVRRSAAPARADSSVAAPVFVDGQLWGALVASTDSDELLPAETEVQLARFTELIATAVSNAATRSELIASRSRIVAAADEERRRIERNLHDGIQQRLLALGLDVQSLQAQIPTDAGPAHEGVEAIVREIEAVLEEVRVLSQGLHPALLSRAGLGPSLKALARRSPIPVDVSVEVSERPPPSIETAVYYVVSEAIANAIKHSEASRISVTVAGDPFDLRASVADDGVGGAELGTGSGLIGLADRVEALGGRVALESPVGGGTTISVELPLGVPAGS